MVSQLKTLALFITAAIAVPALAFAQTIKDFLDTVYNLATEVVPLMIGLAVFFFVFAGSQFIWEAGNQDERSKRRFLFFWGVIALAIAVSVDLIIDILIETFF